MTVPTTPFRAVCPTSPEDPINDDAYEAVITAMDRLIAQAPGTLSNPTTERYAMTDEIERYKTPGPPPSITSD